MRMSFTTSQWALGLLSLAAVVGAHSEENERVEGSENTMAFMLFGSITFQMILFYAVNHRDADIRKYSWWTISQTIAIFSGVLSFQGVLGLAEHYLLQGRSENVELLFHFVHMLLWLVVLQISLQRCTMAMEMEIEDVAPGTHVAHSTHVHAKAWCILMSHITAFASIQAWGKLQQSAAFSGSPLLAFAMVPLSFVGLASLCHVTGLVRHSIIYLDGTEDAYEELWDNEAEEGENDIIGLTCSFLLLQWFRFWATGYLPNMEGDTTTPEHLRSQIEGPWFHLLMLGVVLVAVLAVVLTGRASDRFSELPGRALTARVLESLTIIFTMFFAWSLLYLLKSLTLAPWRTRWLSIDLAARPVLEHVLVALIISGVAFAMILGLDTVADLQVAGDGLHSDILAIIFSLGIMVGFSWEQSFDAGIEVVAERSPLPAHLLKFSLALMVTGIVFPAWKNYILQKIMEEEAERPSAPPSEVPSATPSFQSGAIPSRSGSMARMASMARTGSFFGDVSLRSSQGLGASQGRKGVRLPGMQIQKRAGPPLPHTASDLRAASSPSDQPPARPSLQKLLTAVRLGRRMGRGQPEGGGGESRPLLPQSEASHSF